MDGEKREEAFRNVYALEKYLNNSLTEIYLSSVMKEFHRAQDISDEIMKNDNKDTEYLEAVISCYDAYIDEYNEDVKAANESQSDIRAVLSEYENVELAYQKLLEVYISGSEKDHYAFINQEAYIEKIAEALENMSEDVIPDSYDTWKDFLMSSTEQMQEEDYCRIEPVIPDYAPGQDNIGDIPWMEIQPAKKITEVFGDDETDLKTIILNQTDHITEFVRDEITQIFEGKRMVSWEIIQRQRRSIRNWRCRPES